MKKREARAYLVNLPGLKNGNHEFLYEIHDAFFEGQEGSLVEKGSGQCRMEMKKSDTMMQMAFELDLVVELICDRSLDPFDFPIKERHEMIVKFGESYEELSEDLLVISRDAQTFDVAPHLNEFIQLAIPMKKLHPRYADEESPDLVYQSGGDNEEEQDTPVDPRWEALKKLSNK